MPVVAIASGFVGGWQAAAPADLLAVYVELMGSGEVTDIDHHRFFKQVSFVFEEETGVGFDPGAIPPETVPSLTGIQRTGHGE